VLFGMLELGLRPNSPYKKSARIVGEVLGKYHPHGDAAVYDTMVRMVQDFALRYPLVDGQGNFGSIDGDSPAAIRYTEARLASIAEELLRDLDKNTVDFADNFDGSLKEPTVLPSLLPTLLVNGAAGIAVGMATNIPPHNLSEVVNALVALTEKPSIKPIELRRHIQGPDFPTGALILGEQEINAYFKTGRGKLTVRARAHVEQLHGGRERIVVTEIPYQVNKTSLIEKVANLVRDKKIDGISEIRDESDREGMRIVFELRKEAPSEKVLKDLYKHSQMQTTFGVILLSLVDGQPKILNMKEILAEFLDFRHQVVLRRSQYELDVAEKRAHILEGLKIALDNIDEIVTLIRNSKNVELARKALIKRFKLSEIQAQAILDMRLQRLTGLERRKIEQEYLQVIKLIEKLKSLISSKQRRMQLVKSELVELKEKYGDSRLTQIISKSGQKILTHEEESAIVLLRDGTLLRLPATPETDVAGLLREYNTDVALRSPNSHFLLFFTSHGLCHRLRTSFIPLAHSGGNGTTVERLLGLEGDEKVVRLHRTARFEGEEYLLFCTREGAVKKIHLSALARPKDRRIRVIGLKGDDRVVTVELTVEGQEILIGTAAGMAIRFSEKDVRDMGLAAGGVRGIQLSAKDHVIGMVPIDPSGADLLSITEKGYGKRSELKEYRAISRGGKGIVNYKTGEKVGRVVSILQVRQSDQIITVTRRGRIKRCKAKIVRIMGRATQGMPVINVAKNDEIVRAVRMSGVTVPKT